jgi:hypothetical protein
MFNWFKKRKEKLNTPDEKHQIMLCIPTPCKSSEELALKIVENSNGNYIYAGMVLMNVKTKESFGMEICEKDPAMKVSFEVAGKVNELTDEFLEQIDSHNSVVYLTGNSGSFENAYAIAKAAEAILHSGGIGVKTESSGKAFTADMWLSATEQFDEMKLYELFVLETIHDKQSLLTYSCGMHNIGFKDVAVYNEDFYSAYELIRVFNVFRFVDKPVLNDGETFSLSEDHDRYFLHTMKTAPTDGQELFENPYGFWELKKDER